MSNAWWAYGSDFKFADGTSWTTVAEVTDISGPSMSRDTIDVSNHDGSTGYREFIAGWRDGGEITITANWIPADNSHDGTGNSMLTFFNSDSVESFRIVTPSDGSSGAITIGLDGLVTSMNLSLGLDEQAKVDFGIKISGEVTFA